MCTITRSQLHESISPARRRSRLGAAIVTVLASPALASPTHSRYRERVPFERRGVGAVFVQTDNTAGNEVVAYQREPDGTLIDGDAHSTGGLGGSLTGSVVDHLASQGFPQCDRRMGLLFAVNADGSIVAVFAAFGDHLMQLLRRRSRPSELVCQQAVQLVTEYLEGALRPRDRRRYERHMPDARTVLNILPRLGQPFRRGPEG
jgi:hypothetical protein